MWFLCCPEQLICSDNVHLRIFLVRAFALCLPMDRSSHTWRKQETKTSERMSKYHRWEGERQSAQRRTRAWFFIALRYFLFLGVPFLSVTSSQRFPHCRIQQCPNGVLQVAAFTLYPDLISFRLRPVQIIIQKTCLVGQSPHGGIQLIPTLLNLIMWGKFLFVSFPHFTAVVWSSWWCFFSSHKHRDVCVSSENRQAECPLYCPSFHLSSWS